MSVNWQTLVAAALLMVTLIGGQWAMWSQQIAYLDKNDVQLREEFHHRETEIKAIQQNTNQILEKDRAEFIDRNEYVANRDSIKAQLEIILDRIKVIESTRPTTGELQALSKATSDRLDRLDVLYQSLLNKNK